MRRLSDLNAHAQVRQVGYVAGVAGYLAAAAALLRGVGETVDVSELEAIADEGGMVTLPRHSLFPLRFSA